VDRPFLFAILDTATGLPLFLGQVTRPATKTT
jgi:serpin B